MSDSNSRQPNVIFILTDDQGPWAAAAVETMKFVHQT